MKREEILCDSRVNFLSLPLFLCSEAPMHIIHFSVVQLSDNQMPLLSFLTIKDK